jgi:sirohydrochlorin cobaltochelatase
MNSDAVILFAHGARDPRWADPFHQVMSHMTRQSPGLQVRVSFLEFMSPDLAAAGAELVGAGCRRIAVVPMFLGAGGHVRKDLPLLVQALREAHPGVDVQLLPAIGEQAAVLDAMAATALQMAGAGPA